MKEVRNGVIIGISAGAALTMLYLAYRKVGARVKEAEKQACRMKFKSQSGESPSAVFVFNNTVKLHPAQSKLYHATLKHPSSSYLSAPEQMHFLAQMARSITAKKTLDIGFFTGYSALSIALVLQSDGRVVACDISEEFANFGKPFWKEAGVDKKIDLRIAPADQTLQHLIDTGEEGTYDFAFIDADKLSYDVYYELCLKLIRKGGIIALDNLLWDGKVADLSITEPVTCALREMTKKLANDPRVTFSLLTVSDGTGLAFKL